MKNISESILEWDMEPVHDENGNPRGVVYRCPYCKYLSREQYVRCGNPFCRRFVAED